MVIRGGEMREGIAVVQKRVPAGLKLCDSNENGEE